MKTNRQTKRNASPSRVELARDDRTTSVGRHANVINAGGSGGPPNINLHYSQDDPRSSDDHYDIYTRLRFEESAARRPTWGRWVRAGRHCAGRACRAVLAADGRGRRSVGWLECGRGQRLQRLGGRVVLATAQRGQLAHPRGQPARHAEQVGPGARRHRAHVHLGRLLLLLCGRHVN